MAAPTEKILVYLQTVLICFVCLCHLSPVNCAPNIVLLFVDDLGYGDLELYGHPTSSTPEINKIAVGGLRFTQFYSASPVCSPSRAALLTGRYQSRSGIWPGVIVPSCTGGLPKTETTLAELLKTKGYSTNIIGKWHLGVGKDNEHLPTNHGFDSYFGVPYSHDMCPCKTCYYPDEPCFNNCDPVYSNCPVYMNSTLVEQPVDLLSLDERYATHATEWIAEKAKGKSPFFLYFSFQHTHHPQYASKLFRNSTLRGVFGDSLKVVDWTVGQVVKQLGDSGVLNSTLIFFTSDNGPSLRNENRGGNAGLLKCGKGTTYEGGMRVPAIAYWPSRIKPGRTMELATTLDIFPTIAKLVDAKMPDVPIDGIDMAPILFSDNPKSKRESFYYYYTEPDPKIGIYAVRYQKYKAHFYTQGQVNSNPENHDLDCRPDATRTKHDPPILYDLHQDPSEQYALNTTLYPAVMKTIMQLYYEGNANMTWGASQLKDKSPDVEPCCNKGCTPFPDCCHCESKDKDSMWNKYSRKVNGNSKQ